MSTESDLGPAKNGDPVSYRCSWRFCRQRLVMERNGYWWTCPDGAHGSSHDPRRRGPRAWLHAALGWWAR